MKTTFFVEMTDTYGGSANYCWVRRYLVKATTMRGAIRIVAKHTGYSGRLKKVADYGDMTRHDAKGACICFFTSYYAEEDYLGMEELP